MKTTCNGRLFFAPTLWTSTQLEVATGGTALGPNWAASGVAVDLEGLLTGNVFIALEDGDYNGHDHVQEALERGAAAAIVRTIPDDVPADAPLLLVEDTYQALKDLSKIGRHNAQHMKVVAITGAVGKSGVKNILAYLLRQMRKSVVSVKDAETKELQNHHGIPCSLSNASEKTDFGLFDIGLQRIGETAYLSREIMPSIAVITNIGMAGLNGFASLDDMAIEAARLFDAMAWGGTAILNRDDPYYDLFVAQARTAGVSTILSFGKHEKSDAQLIGCRTHGFKTEVTARLDNQIYRFYIPAIGKHWAYHALACLLVIKKSGMDISLAIRHFESMPALQHRGNTHVIYPADAVDTPIQLIDETIHASLASLDATLDYMARQKPATGLREKNIQDNHLRPRKIAVLGEMQDLRTYHHDIFDDLTDAFKESGIEKIISYGRSPFLSISERHFNDAAELAVALLNEIRPGDIVLMKGHQATELRHVIKALYSIEKTGTRKENISPFPSLVEKMDVVEFRSRKTANDR